MKTFLSRALILSSFLIFSACGDDDTGGSTSGLMTDPNDLSLKARIADDIQFSIFNDALDQTGLGSTLDGSGTYTVFAPTNVAFDALIGDLGYSDLASLIQGIGLGELRDILTYHVLNGKQMAASLQNGYYSTLTAANSKDSLHFYLERTSQVEINERAIIQSSDIEAQNGVIHSVSNVLLPLSVYGLLEVNPDYSSLEAAIGLADGDLRNVLSNTAVNYTIFAPNNAAFDTIVARIPNVNNLFEFVADLGTDALANLILYHATSGIVYSDDLQTGNLSMLASDGSGGSLEVFVNIGSDVRLIDLSPTTDDAVITSTDIIGTNGAVHFLNGVMLTN